MEFTAPPAAEELPAYEIAAPVACHFRVYTDYAPDCSWPAHVPFKCVYSAAHAYIRDGDAIANQRTAIVYAGTDPTTDIAKINQHLQKKILGSRGVRGGLRDRRG